MDKTLFVKALLRVLEGLPVYRYDVGLESTKALQFEELARSIAVETRSIEEAGFVVTLGRFESNFSAAIHAGLCRSYECDPDRFGIPRARGVFQLHRNGMPEDLWDRMVGFWNTRYQVREASRRARWALRTCQAVGPVGAFRILGTSSCVAPLKGEEDRMAIYRGVVSDLYKSLRGTGAPP